MIDAIEIRDAIAGALADQLGTYAFSTGDTTPAIRIDDGSDPYDEEPAVAGLEVVIVPGIEAAIALMLGGYQQTFGALITLKQWDISETTLAAMEAVLAVLAAMDAIAVGSPRRVLRSPKIGNIETLTIPISQSFLYQQTFND